MFFTGQHVQITVIIIPIVTVAVLAAAAVAYYVYRARPRAKVVPDAWTDPGQGTDVAAEQLKKQHDLLTIWPSIDLQAEMKKAKLDLAKIVPSGRNSNSMPVAADQPKQVNIPATMTPPILEWVPHHVPVQQLRLSVRDTRDLATIQPPAAVPIEPGAFFEFFEFFEETPMGAPSPASNWPANTVPLAQPNQTQYLPTSLPLMDEPEVLLVVQTIRPQSGHLWMPRILIRMNNQR